MNRPPLIYDVVIIGAAVSPVCVLCCHYAGPPGATAEANRAAEWRGRRERKTPAETLTRISDKHSTGCITRSRRQINFYRKVSHRRALRHHSLLRSPSSSPFYRRAVTATRLRVVLSTDVCPPNPLSQARATYGPRKAFIRPAERSNLVFLSLLQFDAC